MNIIEHDRAKFAYDRIKDLFSKSDKNKKKELKSWASKFPSMIASCGLLQTVVFYFEKDKGKELYEVLENWLKKKGLIILNDNEKLHDYLLNIQDFREYLKIQVESIKFLTWVKRFASILAEE